MARRAEDGYLPDPEMSATHGNVFLVNVSGKDRPGLVAQLAGVMAVAPLGADADRAFAKLADISAALRADHPAAAGISAGMSQDLESAIRHGATHLRIGSDILGSRPAAR